MSNFRDKVQPAVKKETKNVAIYTCLLYTSGFGNGTGEGWEADADAHSALDDGVSGN